jgi:ribonuclease HII
MNFVVLCNTTTTTTLPLETMETGGVILSKKPRQQREVRILSTSYHPSGTGDDADTETASTHKYEIGVDEAGRGPLFGRVYTGAVILPPAAASVSFDFSLLKDSKKFTSEKKIREVSDYIKQHAVAWAVSYEEPAVIDMINIRRATLQCMRNAINAVVKKHSDNMSSMTTPTTTTPTTRPTTDDYLLLIDGNDFIPMGNYNQQTTEIENYRHICVEGGDDTYACIAAGSILAKVARDDYIEKLCDEYPVLDELYSLRGNKGYGAKKHMDGIREHGITQWHRRSYGICRTFE